MKILFRNVFYVLLIYFTFFSRSDLNIENNNNIPPPFQRHRQQQFYGTPPISSAIPIEKNLWPQRVSLQPAGGSLVGSPNAQGGGFLQVNFLCKY